MLTYRELSRLSGELAGQLVAAGAAPDVAVGVLAERSPEMVVALVAAVRSSGACLPLDPTAPPERLRYLLADSGAHVVVAQPHLVERVAETAGRVVVLDPHRWSPGCGESAAGTAPHVGGAPESTAFLLYTSGSTGAPKGVMLPHRAVVNHVRVVTRLYQLGPEDRVLQFCSPSFDVSIEEIFPTLASGGTVVLRDDAVPILGRAWLRWLGERRISVLNLPTAFWHEWARDLVELGEQVPASVRLVMVGGEKALGRAYRQWLQAAGGSTRWINLYGPTEATIGATYYEPPAGAPPAGWEDPPIGRPLPGTTTHVLDPQGQPVGVGETGELHLGGDRLARGYWRRPELTQVRFVPDVFSAEPGARMYRTGDLVRGRPDGDLEFVGRVDDQVKVRGFRIETSEVEAALLAHPGVAAAAVIAREDVPGVRRLVAYAVPAVGAGDGDSARGAGEGDSARGAAEGVPLTGRRLRHFLGQRLPRSMLPTEFVMLGALPLTPGGKVDRRALPAPAGPSGGAARPATPTEETLAAIWSQVLEMESVGAEDDFFDLGGHSLLATQVVVRARETFGVAVTLADLFDAPTVRQLAERIDRRVPSPDAVPPLVAVPRRGHDRFPLTLAQQQMWRLEAEAKPPGLYNITVVRSFDGDVDAEALRRSLGALVERHESLRTSFGFDRGLLSQVVEPPVAVELPEIRIDEGDLEAQIAADDSEAFELAEAPLVRARLYRTGAGAVLVATLDHMVADGTSAYILLSELDELYQARVRGQQARLAPLPVQYGDYALWQQRWLTEERLSAQVEYWRQALAGMPLGPALPFDHVPTDPTRRILCRDLRVSAAGYTGLRALASQGRATPFVAAATIVQAALLARSGQSDVVLSTTMSGRQRAELEGVIGYFAGVGRIRTDLSGDPTLEEAVERTRAAVVGLFDHQDVPFMRIRAAVSADFPVTGKGDHPLAALPVELQYFHAGADGWARGLGVVERPGTRGRASPLFFRGQLHPLSITLLDDGDQLWGEINYKADFYHPSTIEALARAIEGLSADSARSGAAQRRLSQLVEPWAGPPGDGSGVAHRPVGSWRLGP